MGAGLIPADLYECPVVESRQIGAYRQVSFVAPEIAALSQPGQFMMVRRTGDSLDPLLPRPMGIHDVDADLVKILIDPVGKGTVVLADAGVGDRLSVLGPLGSGFDLEGEGPAVLVAGGMGTAPLTILAKALASRGREVTCILGFKTRSQAIVSELYRDVHVDVLTEDGSAGGCGMACGPLPGLLDRRTGQPPPEIFACGPAAMLAEVVKIARQQRVRAQVSVAAHMACGIGSCQGCVVRGSHGYIKACTEGPVFDAEDLEWK